MSFKSRIIKWNIVSLLSVFFASLILSLIAARMLYVRFFNAVTTLGDAVLNPIFRNYCAQLLVVILCIFTFIIIIAASIFYYKVSKNIEKPLSSLIDSAKEMSLGNFDYKLTYSGVDEIGDATSYLQELQNKLKKYINKISEQQNSSLELISSISHDLRTPITTILGYTEGILDNVADTEEKRKNYLLKIKKKALDLDNLIDQLLTSAKLDLNKISYQLERTDVVKYITEVIDEIKIDLDNNNVIVSFVYEQTESYVLLDKTRFKRVVLNIISNAIKYKKNGEGRMEIKFQNASDSIVISFTDNGAGIENTKLPHIFNSFYRCDDSRKDTSNSSGLGLSIAKLIVEGHGGKIWAKSKLSEGTTINISISNKRG